MCEKLYKSHWYTLPIKYQKDLQRLMDESQHGVRVPFGPIGIVNREFLKSVSAMMSANQQTVVEALTFFFRFCL